MSDRDRDRVHGTVISWDLGGRGYGFLRPDGHNVMRDVFYHSTALGAGVHSLGVGERVTFVEVEGERGLKAADVQLEKATSLECSIVDRSEKEHMR